MHGFLLSKELHGDFMLCFVIKNVGLGRPELS